MESRVSVGFVRDVIQFAAAQGASVDELCRAGEISPDILTRPDAKIAARLSQKVWEKAEELTGDANIGLHIGEFAQPATLGLVGFVMVSCQTLGEALDRLIKYTNLLTDGVKGRATLDGRMAEIQVDIVDDRENFLLSAPRQPIESTFSAIVTIARVLTGRDLPLREVSFLHDRPKDVAEHKRIFGSPVRFSSKVNSLRFAAEAREYPVLLANRDLLPAFESQAESKLLEIRQAETRSTQVERQIVKRLNGELPDIVTVARSLGVSERNLQRELAREGKTFRDLLDSVRHQSAIRYLSNRETSVAETSFILGFSEPSAFHRAFKRWTGTTPNAYRAELRTH